MADTNLKLLHDECIGQTNATCAVLHRSQFCSLSTLRDLVWSNLQSPVPAEVSTCESTGQIPPGSFRSAGRLQCPDDNAIVVNTPWPH